MAEVNDKYRQRLINAYRNAGPDFLALKLTRVFCRIESDKDRILHNDIIEDMDIILGAKAGEFLKQVAEEIIYRPKQKNILLTIAKIIGQLSLFKERQDEQKTS